MMQKRRMTQRSDKIVFNEEHNRKEKKHKTLGCFVLFFVQKFSCKKLTNGHFCAILNDIRKINDQESF